MVHCIDQQNNMLQISIVQVHLVLKPFHFNQGKRDSKTPSLWMMLPNGKIIAVDARTSPLTPTNRDIDKYQKTRALNFMHKPLAPDRYYMS